ncbi:MAG TPA: hypothetical protein VNK95_05900 [Caldilineaceae bacterium]|nr:hypothetical protein [Caldilineaceae bacterium]
MNTRQLRDLVAQIEALKTPGTSAEFQAGVDAAKELINNVVQEALDRERIQKLEAELAELRAKYPDATQPIRKRRGRRPKSAQQIDTMPQEAVQS